MADIERYYREWIELSNKVAERVETIRNLMFSPEECMLCEEVAASRGEYEELFEKYRKKYEGFEKIINDMALEVGGLFIYDAYCAACGNDVRMFYHGLGEDQFRQRGGLPGFREEFFCPVCGGQGRTRYISSTVKRMYKRGMRVYMYEHNAPAYRAVSSFVLPKDLVGSEFFGAEYQSGEYVNGILHEDAANLSFADESFDLMVSLDVFEHIYFYERAFEEVKRVLKPGGKLLLTIPMQINRDKTEDRAKIVDGKTVFIKEPVYHGGGSEAENGLLEYTTFGWDLVSKIRSVGFSKVDIRTYYSINEAYFGVLNFYFDITK